MRHALLLILCALLQASVLPLALGPPPAPPAPTPACPAPAYPDAAALLAALPGAGYTCAEELAAALRPLAGPAEADTLIHMVLAGSHARAQRNALRALGRLAESPRGSRARELVLRARAAAVQMAVANLLAHEHDSFLLQDAIWLLDTFFYPALGAAPALERVAAAPDLAPALRSRAATARARLIYARLGLLHPADRDFILDGLRSGDPGMRAAAAMAVARLRSAQLDPAARDELGAALGAAWGAEPPLALAPDAPDPRDAGLLGPQESAPTSLTARAAIATAQERLGDTGRLAKLRAAYEALALPSSVTEGDLTIRGGLAPAVLQALLAEAQRARTAVAQILGPTLGAPLPGESGRHLSILIFARQGVYRDYMRAFTPFTVEVDGIYDETSATLYTHQRTPAQSEHTLEESLRHELAHHEAATRLFPGQWHTPGYHAEPKGWADEGLAEILAGLVVDGPRPRPRQLARLCATGAPDIAALLARRTGYDQFGSFDYDGAWALSAYLLAERPESLRRLYAAYRDGTYTRADWGRIAGLTLPLAQTKLTGAVRRWCEV
jgi:hypothetical protein